MFMAPFTHHNPFRKVTQTCQHSASMSVQSTGCVLTALSCCLKLSRILTNHISKPFSPKNTCEQSDAQSSCGWYVIHVMLYHECTTQNQFSVITWPMCRKIGIDYGVKTHVMLRKQTWHDTNNSPQFKNTMLSTHQLWSACLARKIDLICSERLQHKFVFCACPAVEEHALHQGT